MLTANGLRALVVLIILVEAVFGVLYALNTPPWEAPDEPAQFNYVQHVAYTATLPELKPGDYNQAYLEKLKADRFPTAESIDSVRYESYQPPLYYVAAAPIYLMARAAGRDPMRALRLFSVALCALGLVIAYRALRNVFPERPYLAVAGLGFIATVPMHIAMNAAINADVLAEVLVAAILLLTLRRASGQVSDRQYLLIGGVLYGLALLTSIKTYPIIAVMLLADIQYRGWNTGSLIKSLKVMAPLVGLALLISVWWFARNALLYGAGDIFGLARHDAVVVGQPTTAQGIASAGIRHIVADFFRISFKSFWAQFGWMGVLVSDRIYIALLVLTAAAIVGALLFIIRIMRERGSEGVSRYAWVLLASWLLICLAAHVWYNLRYIQPQGRYLFPAMIPIAAFWVIGLRELLSKRYVRALFVVLYVLGLGLDYISLYWYIIPQLRG